MNEYKRADATWMRAAKWGVFTHFLAGGRSSDTTNDLTIDQWNRAVEKFDVETHAAQLAEMGAGYAFLTLGQNSGYFCSPNATYDAIVDAPRLSERDLIGDFADALGKRGIRAMTYLPCHAPMDDHHALKALRGAPCWDGSVMGLSADFDPAEKDPDDRLTEFQRHWESIIREWSCLWGDKIHGWWIDGCYRADMMYRHDDAPNFRSFAEAMKAGNPDSLVAFNPGLFVPLISHTPYEDYIAGEAIAMPTATAADPMQGEVGGAQLHVLSFLGPWFSAGEPRYPDDLVVAYTRYLNSLQGAMSWDVPAHPDGSFPDAYRRQLGALAGI